MKLLFLRFLVIREIELSENVIHKLRRSERNCMVLDNVYLTLKNSTHSSWSCEVRPPQAEGVWSSAMYEFRSLTSLTM